MNSRFSLPAQAAPHSPPPRTRGSQSSSACAVPWESRASSRCSANTGWVNYMKRIKTGHGRLRTIHCSARIWARGRVRGQGAPAALPRGCPHTPKSERRDLQPRSVVICSLGRYLKNLLCNPTAYTLKIKSPFRGRLPAM